MKGLFLATLVVCLLAAAASSFAVEWNCLAQFSPTSNTEDDTWQYGYRAGGPFTRFCCATDWAGWLGSAGLVDGWDDGSGGAGLASGAAYPSAIRNITGSDISDTQNKGNGAIYTNGLYGWPAFGRAAVLRWKAPAAGIYNATGFWRICHAGCDDAVAINTSTGSVNWTGALPGTGGVGDAYTHSVYSISLAEGDSIYFEVGGGSDGNLYNDQVCYDATVYTLDGQCKIQGVVKNSSTTPWPGTALAGVTVEIVAGGSGSTTTASDGSYSLGPMAPGTFTLRFSKTDYVSQDHPMTVAADETRIENADMSLTNGAVAGVVKNAAATPWPGTPIEGATVEVVAGGSGSTTTAADGSYALIIAPGTYTIRYSKDGYVWQEFGHVVTASMTNWQDVDLILTDGAVTGTVKHSATAYHPGFPVAGATVEVVGGGASTTTMVGGGYVLIVPPGTYTLKASKVGYLPEETSGVVATAGTTTSGVNFGLGFDVAVWDPLRDFSGSLNPNGLWEYGQGSGYFLPLPYSGYWPANQPPGCPANTVIGWDNSSSTNHGPQFWPDGYPSIAYVKTGLDIVVWNGAVTLPGDKLNIFPSLNNGALVQWRCPIDGSYTIDASFKSIQAGGSQAGVAVYSTTGTPNWTSPLTDAEVALPTTTTNLVAGDYVTFEVNDGGDGALAGDNSSLSATIKLNLGDDGLVGGRVRNSASTPYPGTPVAGATVEIIAGGSGYSTTDTDGTYYLLLAPGTYTIRVSKTLYASQQFEVTVAAGTSYTRNIDLDLTDGAVQGVVKANPYAPNPGALIAGATVEVVGGAESTTTGPDGSYSLILTPGTYTLRASADGYLPLEISGIVVTAGGLVIQDFELWSDPTLWDLVRDFSGDNNPNGAWAYGLLNSNSDATFNVMVWKDTWTGHVTPGTVDGWARGPNPHGLDTGEGYPCWIRNKSGANFTSPFGTLHTVDGIFCYPWFNIPGAVRWTAPVAGSYTINATFTPAYSGGGAAEAGARVRSSSGSVDWSSVLYGPVPAVFPEQTVDLSEGETLLFDVNDYDGENVTNDELNLAATVKLNLGSDSLITGKVTNGDSTFAPGTPVVGATVELVGESSSTTIGADGTYYLFAPAGSYTVRASKFGYAPQQVDVTTVAGEVIIQSFELEFANPIATIATLPELAGKADGTPVELTSPVCATVSSAAFGDGSYYVENLTRTCGLEVVGGSVTPGDRVTLSGILTTAANGEKVLVDAAVLSQTSGTPLRPLAMTNKALGGGPSAYQPGISGASGTNNIALLVTVYGTVSSTEANSFIIEDGSAVGVTVNLPVGAAVPDTGAFVSVTGISSCEKVGADTVRMLKCTSFQQIRVDSPGLAYSTFAGGRQVWMRAAKFIARSGDGGTLNFVPDPAAAANAESGAAYYFPANSPAGTNSPWWAEYEIPQASVPFALDGTWKFYARSSQSASNGAESDWLIVRGDPGDAAYPGLGTPDPAGDRILNEVGTTGGFFDYNFGWFSSSPTTDLCTKEFHVGADDRILFRIYEREACPTNALIDVMCWVWTGAAYTPTDADLLSLAGW